MGGSGSRDKVLGNIRTALKNAPSSESLVAVDAESPVFTATFDSLEIKFVEELQKVNGKFAFCLSRADLIENLQIFFKQNQWDAVFCIDTDLQKLLIECGIAFLTGTDDFYEMTVGITGCEYLVARTGSIVVSSAQQSGRRMNVFPPAHLVVAYTSQIVNELKEAIVGLREKYSEQLPSLISVITGPSRTADIEKTLILGAHGPKELFVFLVNDDL